MDRLGQMAAKMIIAELDKESLFQTSAMFKTVAMFKTLAMFQTVAMFKTVAMFQALPRARSVFGPDILCEEGR
jgi:hypothetical protein